MKYLTAFLLVVVTLASAEPPRSIPKLTSARQVVGTSAPYNARGWRPSGPSFNLPVKSQPQQVYGPPPQQPQPSYGPPPEEPVTTTELPTTTEGYTEGTPTENTLAENIAVEPKTKKTEAKTEKQEQETPLGQFYVVLPPQEQQLQLQQLRQNFIYATPRTAQLVATVPQTAFARLQTVHPVPFTSAVSSSIFTPYSASIVQYIQ